MERYLYFTDPSGAAVPDGDAEIAMYPTSSVTCIFAASATTTTINMVPRDGTETTEDVITLTHTSGGNKVVIDGLVSMINAEKNNNPFQVVADDANGVYNIAGVTACNITSADGD
tara:strand:+ start:112 stop:456 length:345 start_codon:yes stop_codon:yes gene_type:complete